MLVWLVCKYEVHVNIATACLLALTHMRLNVPLGKFPEARLGQRWRSTVGIHAAVHQPPATP
jgi:hypothetical protein